MAFFSSDTSPFNLMNTDMESSRSISTLIKGTGPYMILRYKGLCRFQQSQVLSALYFPVKE